MARFSPGPPPVYPPTALYSIRAGRGPLTPPVGITAPTQAVGSPTIGTMATPAKAQNGSAMLRSCRPTEFTTSTPGGLQTPTARPTLQLTLRTPPALTS